MLGKDETEVPTFLADAFAKGNRLQDILTTNMKTGKTGNEILATSLEQAKKEGLKPSIYSHPLRAFWTQFWNNNRDVGFTRRCSC